MIKIDHLQAKWLITCQLDHWVPTEQWTALLYHLEQCRECRDYQVHWLAQERNLRRMLRARWEPVSGPGEELPLLVVSQCRKTTYRCQHLPTLSIWTVISTLLFLLVTIVLSARAERSRIQHQKAVSDSTVPIILPTEKLPDVPAVKPGQFPHIVVYGSGSTGNEEIYLLNPGSEPVNITQNPAEDTFPTWSPDGEWLAFLSNRDNQEKGKNEIYVISIAGNKLIQLTSDPLINWIGPLSWSADGKWIAAAGVLADSSQSPSIYLIGVNGSGSHPLRDTMGASMPKFSPYGDRLAFQQVVGGMNKLVIYHTRTSQVTFEDLASLNDNPAATEVSYDWAGNGDGLYYTVVQPYNSQRCYKMFIQQTQNSETSLEKLRDHFHLAEINRIGNIHSLSWAPDDWLIYLAASQKPENEFLESEKVLNGSDFFFYHLFEEPNHAIIHTDLCIQSNLDRGSWSLDMRWLTFIAQVRGTAEVRLYAVRMPGLEYDWQPTGVTGLHSANIPVGNVFSLSAVEGVSSPPRMRPFRREMKIEPHPYEVETLRFTPTP